MRDKKARRRFAAALLAGVLLTGAVASTARQSPQIREISATELPREAHETLQLIKQGGPFPHARDGSVFGNRERLLPPRERGYYREYTVKTPGVRDRGARRIVAGGCTRATVPTAPRRNNDAGAQRNAPGQHFVAPCAGGEYYYTTDHYASFRRIRE